MKRSQPREWFQKLRDTEAKNAWVRGALIVAMVLCMALIMAPRSRGVGPSLDESDINLVAERAITATHDFTFERNDPAGIRAVRDAAAAQVIPVWDYDESLETVIDERIQDAFAELRAELITTGASLAPEVEDKPTEGSGEDDDGSGDTAQGEDAQAEAGEDEPSLLPDLPTVESELSEDALIALVPHEVRLEILEASSAARALRDGARDPEAVDLAPLVSSGFSREVEDALHALVGEAMSKHIVEDVAALEAVGLGGVTLRTLDQGVPQTERRVRQLISFGDVHQLDAVIAPARHHLFYIDSELRDAIAALAEALVRVNTRINANETAARVSAAANTAEAEFRATLTQQFREGEIILGQSEVIDATTVAIIQAMQANAPPARSAAYTVLATALLVALLLLPIMMFALGGMARFTHDTKHLSMMASVMLAHLGITRLGIFISDLVGQQGAIPTRALYLVIPLSAGAMIVRILTNAENALVYAILYSLFAGVLFQFDVSFAAAALLGSIVGIVSVRGAQTRTDILRAGGFAGVIILGIALAFAVLADTGDDAAYAWVAAGGFLSGVSSALFVYALLPIIEATFRFTTPMRLMELANLNHPALKELILKAPGSYHHSMMVGQLVESACEAVGADALLGRVGSYFHDIGKTNTPHYFAENQQGVNPHDKLKPNMSALVIKSHVKDGVELAKQYKLPPEIIDFIREHHGTSLIQYFYRRAIELDEGTVNESDYRYPGPKPRTRETAICLLADGVEAASRALPDPSHSHLKGLVQKMINRAFIDGQLDGCDLTLKDLDLIANAFLLRLTAFYHHRPEYPDVRKSQTTKRSKRADSGANQTVTAQDNDGADDAPASAPPDASGASEKTRDDADLNLRRLGM